MANFDFIEIKPKNHPKACVIWLHGLGADGYDFVDIVPTLNLPEELAIHFIFPHAPIRPITLNSGYKMRAWFDIYDLDPTAEQDQTGIEQSGLLVKKLIAQEIANEIPANKIVLAGFSQGAALALHVGLRYEQKIAGILALSGFLAKTEQNLTADKLAHANTPILMLHGTDDQIVPLEWAKSSYDKLLDHGFNIKWQTFPMQHNVCAEEIDTIATWLKEILA